MEFISLSDMVYLTIVSKTILFLTVCFVWRSHGGLTENKFRFILVNARETRATIPPLLSSLLSIYQVSDLIWALRINEESLRSDSSWSRQSLGLDFCGSCLHRNLRPNLPLFFSFPRCLHARACICRRGARLSRSRRKMTISNHQSWVTEIERDKYR